MLLSLAVLFSLRRRWNAARGPVHSAFQYGVVALASVSRCYLQPHDSTTMSSYCLYTTLLAESM